MEIRVGDKTIVVERARLRKWFELEDIRENIRKAAEGGETLQVADLLCSYLSAASSESQDIFENASWLDVAQAFSQLEVVNSPHIRFPILDDAVSHKEAKSVAWDYAGRMWYSWVHLLASRYGWTVEYVSNLEIEDGVALIQEIMVDEQLQKEWQYSLSEIAYPFDPSTKKSRFQPLQRPHWMAPRAVIKITKMRRDMLPVGVIENISGMALHGQVSDVIH